MAKRNSERNIIAIVIVVILAAAVIIALFRTMGPGLPQVTYNVSDGVRQQLLQSLVSSGTRIGVENPSSIRWQPGESGIFAAGIWNRYNLSKTFYINVYLEDTVNVAGSPNANSWLAYSKTLDLGAHQARILDMAVVPASNAPTGMYFFRVAACQSAEQDCHIASAGYPTPSSSLYANTAFSVEIA